MTDEAFILSLARDMYRSLYGQLMGYAKAVDFPELYNDIEDCIQEAFLLLYADIDRLRSHENLHGWLFLTAQHLLFNSVSRAKTRRKHVSGSMDDDLYQYKAGKQFDEMALSESRTTESTEEMLNQIKDLIGSEAYAFLLDYFSEGNTAKSIGEKYGISEANVWKRCQRLVNKIKKLMFVMLFIFMVSGFTILSTFIL